jgi:hypothetical protein
MQESLKNKNKVPNHMMAGVDRSKSSKKHLKQLKENWYMMKGREVKMLILYADKNASSSMHIVILNTTY